LRNDGTAWCWGYNYYGALGNGNTTQQTAPVAVSTAGVSGTSWTDISVSIGYHACGIRNDGSMWCWGYGEDGEMGNNTYTVTNTTPKLVDTTGVTGTAWTGVAPSNGPVAASVTTEPDGAGAITHTDSWGNGTIAMASLPQQISTSNVTGTAWTYLTGGGLYACGVRNDGTACAGAIRRTAR
jgi:hypothetical protein